ncbi:MAG: xanthine dehydrogenase family protein molybdopterin-binding subunit [Candidatus Eremiobacteraeota bacterium]|nr:xanthine dehydrogenase family protein molybdopterin-binding subunit [Candidatus Eremiobacteraeota bacterium]
MHTKKSAGKATQSQSDEDAEGVPIIGIPFPRADAREKVAGLTAFAADFYRPGMLWAGVKRAGIPHGIIKSIDTAGARAMKGVVAVLTAADIPGVNLHGVVKKDQPVLAGERVRHCGDAVALVVAETRESLTEALGAICCDFEVLPGVFSPQEALREGAPCLHEGTGNVLFSWELVLGKGRDALPECDVTVESEFVTSWQEHAYMETESGWAEQGSDGRITIVCSTQTPFRDRTEVAEVMAMKPGDLRIVAPYAGGAFGGKDGVTVQCYLALAALHGGGRPVKMWLSREESFIASTKRHPSQMRYRLGATSEGFFHFLEAHIVLDTGPYDSLGSVVLALAMEHAAGAYMIPHGVLQGKAVYTNNPVGGAFRGFGVPQVTAAIEQVVDMMALELHADRWELRMKNAVKAGGKTYTGITLTSSTGARECLDRLSMHEGWSGREAWKAAAGHFKKRGTGLALSVHAQGYGPVVPDEACARVELTPGGRFKVYCGVVDMGQGNASANLQIAGAILNQRAQDIELVLPDTDKTQNSGSAAASRCTYTFGNALIGACTALKSSILSKAADIVMTENHDDMLLVPGAVFHRPDGREIPLASIASELGDKDRSASFHFTAPTAPERPGGETMLTACGLPHAIFSYGAHCASVEVDLLTGEATVLKYIAVTDSGAVINPLTYEQQVQGAIVQGIGYALTEEFIVEKGRCATPDLSAYLIPASSDVPEVESVAVELHESTGPFGLKGMGEISINGPLPAIVNAVADACGVRISCYPLTGERILEALKEKSPW